MVFVAPSLRMLAFAGFMAAAAPFALAEADLYQSMMEADAKEIERRLQLTPEQKDRVVSILQTSVKKRIAVFDQLGIRPGTKPSLRTLLTLRSQMSAIRSQDHAELEKILSEQQMLTIDEISSRTRERIRADLLGD